MISHDPAPSHQSMHWGPSTRSGSNGSTRHSALPQGGLRINLPRNPGSSHPTWWKSISWAQQNLRNQKKTTKFICFWYFSWIFSMKTYEHCRNLVHPPDKTTRLRHRSSRLAGLGPASGWKSQEYDHGPAMFQHVLTCFNIISCRILETFWSIF